MSSDELDFLLGELNGTQDPTPDPRLKDQKSINRSRNYLRYKVSRNLANDDWKHHPLLTEEEKFLFEQMQDHRQALTNLKVAFFTNFYENCPKVGSTLKRKVKKTAS